MAFDYTDSNNDEAARAVAAEMTNSELRPLSESEWLERQAWREECHRRDREMHEEYLATQAAKEAVAERERAIAAKAERDKAQRLRAAEIDRLTNQRTLSSLQLAATRQDTFREAALRAHANAVRQQSISNILSEINAMANPPAPPEPEPEPEIDPGSPNIGDDNYNPRYVFDRAEMLRRRRRSWW
jgi:hypothetical protein